MTDSDGRGGRPVVPDRDALNIRTDRASAQQFRDLVKMTGQAQGAVFSKVLRHGAPWLLVRHQLEQGGFDDDPKEKRVAELVVGAHAALVDAFFVLAQRFPRMALAASPDGRPPAAMTEERAAELERILGTVRIPKMGELGEQD